MNNNAPNFIPTPPAQPNYIPTPPAQPNYTPTRAGGQTKSKFLTFIFSLIPGAGQMYQGLMKRGLSIMLIFTGIIAASIFTYLSAMIIILPAVWFYSFFDTINRINFTREELARQKDEFLLFGPSDGGSMKSLKQVFEQRHLLLGIGIIVFSIWLILKLMFRYYFIYSNIPEYINSIIGFIINFLPSMIIPAACIYIGVRLIKGGGSCQKTPASSKHSDTGGEE